MGIKIFSDFISKKNEDNDLYFYECLASVNEFSPYDMQIQKHDLEDWGSYTTTYHEIKMRNENISIDDYETSVIDLYKISTLQKIAYQTNNRCFVNVIYPKDRKILQWEIDPEMKFVVENKKVNWKSQSIAQNKQVTLDKTLVELPISEAKKFRY